MDKRTICTSELKVTIGQPRIISSSARAEGEHIYPMLWRLYDGALLLSYHLDRDINLARRACLRSVDNGETWSLDPPRVAREEAMIQLRDGTVLVLDYITAATAPGSKQSRGSMCRSRDRGKTFEGPIEVTVNMPRHAGTIPERHGSDDFEYAMVFWREGLEMPDGSLLAAMYGWWAEDVRFRSVVAVSKDQGLTFDYLSTVGYDPDSVFAAGTRNEGFNESALSWTSAGDILCMMRIGQLEGQPLHQARSSDYGRTWSKPASVGVCSVDPDLVLMSHGVLACSYGRDGNFIMFDPTGTGESWQEPILVQWEGGLTGYTGTREIAPGKLLHVYDAKCLDEVSGQVANCLRGVEISVERQ